MALVLKNIFTSGSDQISQNFVIESWHVSQSIDAFTGNKEYDITLSGSFKLTGSQYVTGSISASLGANTVGFHGTSSFSVTSSYGISASYSISSSRAESSSYAISSSYATSASYSISSSRAESSSYAISSSYATSASYAISSSIADFATNIAYSYTIIDDITFTSSGAPFPVSNITPYNIYVSQSSGNILNLSFANGVDGQMINFTPGYLATNLDLTLIAISASVEVVGLGGGIILAGTSNTANNIFTGSISNVKNLTFQYINPGVIPSPNPWGPLPGWYLINNNTM